MSMSTFGIRGIICDLDFIAPGASDKLLHGTLLEIPNEHSFRLMTRGLPPILVSITEEQEMQARVLLDNLMQVKVGTIEELVLRCKHGSITLTNDTDVPVLGGNIMVVSDNLVMLLKLRKEKACQTVFSRSILRTLERIHRLESDPFAFQFSIDCRREFSISEIDGLQKSYIWEYFQTRYPIMSIDYYGELCKLLNQPVGWAQERVEGVTFADKSAFCTDIESIEFVNEFTKLELIKPFFPRPIRPSSPSSSVTPAYLLPLGTQTSNGSSDYSLLRDAMIASTQEAVLTHCAARVVGGTFKEDNEDDSRFVEVLKQSTEDQTEDPAMRRALRLSIQEDTHQVQPDEMQKAMKASMEEPHGKEDDDELRQALHASMEGEDELQLALRASMEEYELRERWKY
eukprot:GEMP01035209.1.p1 GENE.GEMP01035209.1~~GEMP01035209.1.p1  ORF type:complete len:400 (+),score=80.91 GEMP01035209.1:188-1387(+)